MNIYPGEMFLIKSGEYTAFKAKQSQIKTSNWAVYGKAKDTGRWRALTACEPDQEGAEHLASVLNNSFTGPLWMPQ